MEEYKKIKDYDYEISNLGNVRNMKTNKILKNQISTSGYYDIKIDGKHFKIHKLIGIYFIDNPNEYKCVDHIDRNKLNNNINNLRWCTYSDNLKNKTKKLNTSSKYTGVSKYRKGYESYVWNNYKKIRIGYFKTEEEAYNKRANYIKKINNEYYMMDK